MRLEIKAHGKPVAMCHSGNMSVILEGVDITNDLQRLYLTLECGEMARATVSFLVDDLIVSGDVLAAIQAVVKKPKERE